MQNNVSKTTLHCPECGHTWTADFSEILSQQAIANANQKFEREKTRLIAEAEERVRRESAERLQQEIKNIRVQERTEIKNKYQDELNKALREKEHAESKAELEKQQIISENKHLKESKDKLIELERERQTVLLQKLQNDLEIKHQNDLRNAQKQVAAVENKRFLEIEQLRSENERMKKSREEIREEEKKLAAEKLQRQLEQELEKKEIADKQISQRKLEEERQQWEAEKQKALAAERENTRRVELEKQRMQEKIEKASQSGTSQISQELKGEVNEVIIRENLTQWFPDDTINDVPKGQSGADLIQTVNYRSHLRTSFAGKIIYELKNTKVFQTKYIDKLRKDVFASQGEFGILAVRELPADMKKQNDKIRFDNSVVICQVDYLHFAATVLRNLLIRQVQTKKEFENYPDKRDLLYKRVTSQRFQNALREAQQNFEMMQSGIVKFKKQTDKFFKHQDLYVEQVVQTLINVEQVIDATLLIEKKDDEEE